MMCFKFVITLLVLSYVHAQEKEFQIGARLELPCTVPDPFTEVKWTHRGTKIIQMDTNLQVSGNEDPSRISINTTKGDNLGDLYIEKIVYDDEGVYVCIVTSPKSSRESYDVSVVVSTTAPPNTTTHSLTTSPGSPSTEGGPVNQADHVTSISIFCVCAFFVILQLRCL
ncbi:uncharacterized protein LOC111128670 [Crassostrea virginica]|uniref:Uncharacterized protein LOC111128670 n=1 Tax=Crassostrea virginica TaxID=6565 RepID=A0A8B8DQN5_CRAVI|nr:uncharacterized protein LOC111128670 [Crassostrea virginica]